MIYFLESTIQPLNNSNQVNAHCCKFFKRSAALTLKHSQQYIVNIFYTPRPVMGFICRLGNSYSYGTINQRIADILICDLEDYPTFKWGQPSQTDQCCLQVGTIYVPFTSRIMAHIKCCLWCYFLFSEDIVQQNCFRSENVERCFCQSNWIWLFAVVFPCSHILVNNGIFLFIAAERAAS